MTTITLEIPPEMELQLQQAAKTQGKGVETFVLESVRRHLRRDWLSESETKLLGRINAPIAPEARLQRDALIETSHQRELTEMEQSRLAQLIDDIEQANALRWKCLADLAERRGVTLLEIAKDLEILLPGIS